MFKQRDYSRSERDDFVLNVRTILNNNQEAVPVYDGKRLIGWKIQSRYE